MKKGNSGARLSFCSLGVKKNGKDVVRQAETCMRLYPVTPLVLSMKSSWLGESYIMERLEEPNSPDWHWAKLTLGYMREVLQKRVWSKKIDSASSDWIVKLVDFLNTIPLDVSLYEEVIQRLFVRFELDNSLVHGDPTLANVLYRDNGELVIVDPISPTGKIPPHWTVDLGKLLQSAIGWETSQFGWEYDTPSCIKVVLDGIEDVDKARAWFWCAIHCLRILPYAKNHTTHQWASTHAREAIINARRYACFTRSISMGR